MRKVDIDLHLSLSLLVCSPPIFTCIEEKYTTGVDVVIPKFHRFVMDNASG